jgi:hypothetical protein
MFHSTPTREKKCGGERWQDLGLALQETMYAMSSSEMLSLDSQLRYLASPDGQETPRFLGRLVTQLRKFPRNYQSIDREEKDYILEAAFFLNDLLLVLERVKRVYTDLPADRRKVIEDSAAHVWAIISDFRLKDFKRKRRGERAAE